MISAQASIAEKYQERQAQYLQVAQEQQKRYANLSWLRLSLFIVGIALLILAWSNIWWLALIATMVFIGLFARFVRWHSSFLQRAKFLKNKALVNGQEIDALQAKQDVFGPGEAFIDSQHPYSYDLDVFGPFSLFQMLNRCTTLVGQRSLAKFLTEPAVSSDILNRQAAVKELDQKLDWRQDLRAQGMSITEEEHGIDRLLTWLSEDPVIAHRPLLKATLWLIPIWVLIGIVLWIFVLPWFVAILFFVPSGLILRQHFETINRLHSLTNRAADTLQGYASILQQVEKQDFTQPYLQQLHQHFRDTKTSASKEIRRLAYYLSQLDVRYNAFAILLEFTLLWDLQWVYQLDKWKEKNRERLPAWFAALAEFEALCSLANLAHNNPNWSYPEVTEAPLLKAEQLGHPLLAADKRVCNDVQMPTQGHIHLITGSNMAGKSTWLRTLGLNVVLALSGGPVCAKTFKLPQLQVYTSMRTQDALHESTSSFYAELKRLKFIIEAVEDTELTGGRPVFFLLDEILKGTNSRDRHTGAKALIRQLIKKRGAGLIATHDLELGALEAEAEGRVENWRIEVDIQNGELHFDYKLKRGVSESFNATLLMRQMGIDIPDEESIS